MARLRTSTNLKVHSKLTRREGTQFPPNPYPERGYPIPPTHLPGEGVPNLLRLPTRREGTLSSLATSLLLSPPPSPLRPWQRPFPFPFPKPLTPAKKKKEKKRKKIKTPAPRRNKTTRSRIFPAHETLPTPACSRKTTGLPMASGWRG